MKQPPEFVRNTVAAALFILAVAAGLYLALTKADPTIIRLFSFVSLIAVILLSLRQRHKLPLLMLIGFVNILQYPISAVLMTVEVPIYYYLSSAMIDLLTAFFIVHYHNDPALLRLFKVQVKQDVPQVFLMALLLAVSSLISCLQVLEVIIYHTSPEFYADSLPFLYEYQRPIKLTLKTLFDICIWSLLLDPKRWRFLQKIQHRFM